MNAVEERMHTIMLSNGMGPYALDRAVSAAIDQMADASLQELDEVYTAFLAEWAEQVGVTGRIKDNADLRRFQKAIARRRRHLNERNHVSVVPQPVARTVSLTREVVEGLPFTPNLSTRDGELIPLELPEDFRNRLATREAGFILDAVASYVADFLQTGPTDDARVADDFIVFRTDFDDFCARCGVSGEDRKLVKRALFHKPGLLEWVMLQVTQKDYIETRVVDVETRHHEPLTIHIQPRAQAITDFDLRINARLWGFLAHWESIATGRVRGLDMGVGYHAVPLYLSRKVLEFIERAKALAKSLPDNDQQAVPALRRADRQRLHQAVYYIMNKWDRGATGPNRRRQAMTISHRELGIERGILARHEKNPHRRTEDMGALSVLCGMLIHDGVVLRGCSGVRREGETLYFDLEEPK